MKNLNRISIHRFFHDPINYLRYYRRLIFRFQLHINIHVQVSFSNLIKEDNHRIFAEHRSSSSSCCHISTLQLNSTYPNLETFIHHRRCRRTRTVFSGRTRHVKTSIDDDFLDAQLIGLEKRFETQKYLSTPDRIELADMLHLSQLQVKTWLVI